MRLHELVKSKGLHTKQRRRGRGNATWTGNYSSRGLKWQKARSGHSHKPFFEGGQTSIVQRLPKARGFTRYFKLVKNFQIVNLGKLNQDERVTDTMEISKASLKALWYIADANGLVKILGDGDYTKHLTFVDIDSFSTSAQQKIQTPGTLSSKPSRTYRKIQKQEKSKSVAKKISSSAAPKTVKKPTPSKQIEPSLEPVEQKTVEKASAKKAPAKKTPVKKTVEKAPAKKAPAKKTPVKKA